MPALFSLIGPLIAFAVGLTTWAVARTATPRYAANDNAPRAAPLRAAAPHGDEWTTPSPPANDPPLCLVEASDAAG